MQYEYIWGKIDYHGCDAEFKCLLLCRRLIINGGIVQDARQEGVLGAQGVLKAQHQCQQNTVKRDPPATGEYCLQHEWLQLERAGDSKGLLRRVDQLRLDQPDALALRSDRPHYDEALQCILLDVLSKHKGGEEGAAPVRPFCKDQREQRRPLCTKAAAMRLLGDGEDIEGPAEGDGLPGLPASHPVQHPTERESELPGWTVPEKRWWWRSAARTNPPRGRSGSSSEEAGGGGAKRAPGLLQLSEAAGLLEPGGGGRRLQEPVDPV